MTIPRMIYGASSIVSAPRGHRTVNVPAAGRAAGPGDAHQHPSKIRQATALLHTLSG
jgi:hypothetical protein